GGGLRRLLRRGDERDDPGDHVGQPRRRVSRGQRDQESPVGADELVAVVVFVVQGMVAGPRTLAVMGGAAIGGVGGGRLARVLPAEVMRWIVITVGTVLTLVYARRDWLPRRALSRLAPRPRRRA